MISNPAAGAPSSTSLPAVQNNKELDNKIAQEERVLTKYRADQFAISLHLRELDDELEVPPPRICESLPATPCCAAQWTWMFLFCLRQTAF